MNVFRNESELIQAFAFMFRNVNVLVFPVLFCFYSPQVCVLNESMNGVCFIINSGFMITARIRMHLDYLKQDVLPIIAGEESEIHVSATFEKQKITSSWCSRCAMRELWCEHVVAAVMYRIKYPDKVNYIPNHMYCSHKQI